MAPVEIPVRPQYYLPPTYGPLLADITMKVTVACKKGRQFGAVTFPIPSGYSGQTVIAFRLQTDPANALQSWHWQSRPDGLNRVVTANIAAQGNDVTVSYTARVLVPGFEVVRTQRRDFMNWLGPTTSVDSSDPGVQSTAKQLLSGANSRSEFVGKAVKWVASRQLRGQAVPTIALSVSSDSLSRASLCAAILRAAKIPARILAYAPNWGERLDAEVWLTQYESEDGTWEMVQPLSGIQYPVRNSAVVLSIASRRDESRAVGNLSAILPDAPSLSTPEISSELTWSPSNSGLRHTTIQVIRNFPRASGARLMPGALRHSVIVTAAARKGQDSWFDEATFKKVIAKGPINLALFLDGKPTMPDHN